MSKLPLHVKLGCALREQRRLASMTQATMADLVGCSLPTVRLVESGKGILKMFAAMAGALELRIEGDALPGAQHVGEALKIMRTRRNISRSFLSEQTQISIPTIASLERGQDCRLINTIQIAKVLGVVLRLEHSNIPKQFFSGVAKSSAYQAWTTPADFLEKLYPVVGGSFDLDPCSSSTDRRKATVRARLYYTFSDDALGLAWNGHVFMNPPYNREVAHWVAKAKTEVDIGNAKTVFGLVAARTDTAWWHDNIAHSADAWLLRGRLKFGGTESTSAAPFASALVAWGLDEEMRTKVVAAFPSTAACHLRPSN